MPGEAEMERAREVMSKLHERFGPGFSSGVHAILVHEGLPSEFGRKEWAEWFFKPAPAAFTWAHNEKLIQPSGANTWRFTDLGLAVRAALHLDTTRDEERKS